MHNVIYTQNIVCLQFKIIYHARQKDNVQINHAIHMFDEMHKLFMLKKICTFVYLVNSSLDSIHILEPIGAIFLRFHYFIIISTIVSTVQAQNRIIFDLWCIWPFWTCINLSINENKRIKWYLVLHPEATVHCVLCLSMRGFSLFMYLVLLCLFYCVDNKN